jgi:hypothetical protein
MSPNTSQAIESGSKVSWAKIPPPTMAWPCAALSLKRKSSPGCSTLNAAPPGDQKFTSSMFGRADRWLYQSKSVTPT